MPGGYNSQRDVDDFLVFMAGARRASPHTVRLYRTSLNSYVAFLRKRDHGTRSATYELVTAWLSSMDTVQPRTIRARLSAARSFHKWMQATGRCQIDPAALVRPPRAPDPHRSNFTRTQIEHVRTGCPTLRQRVIVALLYDCALRVTEAASLPVASVDVQSWRLEVLGKGGKRRTVPIIGERARLDLSAWLAALDSSSCYVLPGSRIGEHLHTVSVHRLLQDAAELSGYDRKPWHPHALRHARAEHLRARGYEPFWIQRFLGHASIAHTSRYVNPPIDEEPRTANATLPADLAAALKIFVDAMQPAHES
jgi:integrase/recombinase XerC